MSLMSKKTLAALAAGALVIAGCGDDATTGSPAVAEGANGVDRAFVADMIPHHESAIVMAKIARQRGESDFVKQLAGDIEASQSREISTMRREDEALDAAGVKPGSLGVPEHMMGMDDDPAKLKTADPFDAAFIAMMIPHHEGAVEMAKVELEKGGDPELKALAQEILDEQERELSEMRKQPGGAGSPATDDDEEHGSGHG